MQNGYFGSAWFHTPYGINGDHNCWMVMARLQNTIFTL